MTIKEKISATVATSFGAGYWPWGPGTAGAVVGVAIWWGAGMVISDAALFYVLLAAIVAATFIGTIATNVLEPIWGEDPSRVVIDETLGVWIPLLVCPVDWRWAALAFILFRFFDILKPLGIRALDRLHGGFWVMADDILAGIYSLLVIVAIRTCICYL